MKKLSFNSILFFLLLLAVPLMLFHSCEKSVSNTESTDVLGATVFGEVEFGITAIGNANTSSRNGLASRSAAVSKTVIDDAHSVLISIEKSDETAVYAQEKIELIRVGDDILSLPLSFTPGDYQITLFQVLDDKNNVLAMTPVEGTPMAGYVTNTLKVDFSVTAEQTERVSLEVISTENRSPNDFGYSTFSFIEVILPDPFLVAVFVYDETTKNFELTNSDIAIALNGTDVSSNNHPASTTLLDLPSENDTDVVSITVSKQGYQTKTVTHTIAYLRETINPVENGGNGPVIIVLNENPLPRPILHYDASDSNSYSSAEPSIWKDLSGNNFHATIIDASYVNEYSGGLKNSGSTRSPKYISVGNDKSALYFNLKKFTLEAWVKKGTFYDSGLIDDYNFQHIFSTSKRLLL